MSDNPGKKPRSYYVDYTKRSRGGGSNRFYGGNRGGRAHGSGPKIPDITFGLRGFLITSADEIKSYLEMRGILEKYVEEMYPLGEITSESDQSKEVVEDGGKKNTESSGDKSYEEELESELKQLRVFRPFKQVRTHCKNSIFLTIQEKFSQIDPILVVDKFFDDLIASRELKTSNTFKVIPILDTFRNNIVCANEAVANILNTLYKDQIEPAKYFIELQSRGNFKLDSEYKQKMVEGVAKTVNEHRPNWSVSREDADFIIVLVILRDVCSISFLKHYFKRARYNVMELFKDPEEKQQNKQVENRPAEEGDLEDE